MNSLHADFETRSAVDLGKAGVHIYATDPTTDVMCFAYAWNDAPVRAVRGAGDGDFARALAALIDDADEIVAHNAAFEINIWHRLCVPKYGWPPLPVEKVRCTMAQCYALSLPPDLNRATAAVGLPDEKDMAGNRLMKQMMKPRNRKTYDRTGDPADIVWWDDDDRMRRLMAYCKQDVEAERKLDARIMRLPASEAEMWQLDQRINDRGFQVDSAAIGKLLRLIDAEGDRLAAEMREINGLSPNQTEKLTGWLNANGVAIDGLAKDLVAAALADETVTGAARHALEIRQEAAKSSTKKLPAMQLAADDTGRVRGTFQYHGANTGRWAGRRVQPHNLPRPSLKFEDIEAVLDLLETVT